jgi:hypothetical protein
MTNIDISDGNGPDTLTVSRTSPLLDLLGHMSDTYRDPLLLVEDLTNYTAHIQGALRDAVIHARQLGESWSAIGECLGMSKQAAQQRYGAHA